MRKAERVNSDVCVVRKRLSWVPASARTTRVGLAHAKFSPDISGLDPESAPSVVMPDLIRH